MLSCLDCGKDFWCVLFSWHAKYDGYVIGINCDKFKGFFCDLYVKMKYLPDFDNN